MWPKVQFLDAKACYPKSILKLDHVKELHSSNHFQIPERLQAVAWINFNSCILTRFISTVTKIVLLKAVTELTDQLHVLDSFIHKNATKDWKGYHTTKTAEPCWCKTESSGVEKNDAEFYDFLGYRPKSIPNPTSRIKCLHKSPSLLIFGDRQATKRTTKPLTVVHAYIHT